MKIAVSSTNKDLNGNVAETFGRCPYFVIAEIEKEKTENTEVVENNDTDQVSGAGISAARLIAEKNVDALIVKNIGPRAADVLKQFKIDVYKGEGAIKEVLQAFIDKKLNKIK